MTENTRIEPRYSCRYYTGYKPCGRHPWCNADCPRYETRGKKILILKLGAMGDVLRTTPLTPILKRLHDPCTITWITAPESLPLLKSNPFVDRPLSWGLEAALIAQAETFDLTLNFEKETEALALDALTQAEEKRGFRMHPEGGMGVHNRAAEYALRLGIDDTLKFQGNEKTMPAILAEMAELPYQGEGYVLEPGPVSRAFEQDFRTRHQLDRGRPVIGLNTGCGAVFPTKQWPRRHFEKLIDLLHAEQAGTLLLLGGTRERQFNRAILETAPKGAVVDAGTENSLEAFLGIIETCDVVVSADSLAMHLAIGRHKPTIALIGPTSHQEIDLFGRGRKLIADLDCAPCYRTACEKQPFCMDTIAPQAVADAVKALLPS